MFDYRSILCNTYFYS